VLYAVRDRHVGTGWWGAVLAVGGAASVLGALVAPKMARWLGLGRGIVAASVGTIPAVLLQPVADGPLWTVLVLWAVAQAETGLGVGPVNVLIFTLRARITPDRLLGRVGASSQLLVFGALPIGALAGGALAHGFGDRTAMWVTAVWEIATVALLLPLWRKDPEPVERAEPAALGER
jgi:MFS family permease